ncbi:hypothetical protein V9K67_20685 [Paraflavisolibacter sp. H34]|uniref:hypothetical protein n=1 Tax=Huijunlia imazamoxiresistens TaxID=3127457 RepID=UPI00301797BA
MIDYQNVREYLLNQDIILNGVKLSESDYFNYEKDELKNVFEQYFDFCLNALRRNEDKYQIRPSFVIFLNNFSVNARAGLVNGNFLILLNMGLIANLYPFFLDYRFNLRRPIYNKFEVIDKHFDSSPEWLMFQIATQFTFYHEQAHLIQKSELLQYIFQENYADGSEGFSLEHHVLEIDADSWGAHFVCYHIVEYWHRQRKEIQTKDTLIALLTLGLSSIFSYFIFLSGGRYKIYLKESTHPHPSLRIAYMADTFLNVAEQSFQTDFQVDKNLVLVDCFRICEEMFKERRPEINYVEIFLRELREQIGHAQGYITEMQAEIRRRPYLTVNNFERLLGAD